MPTGRLPSILVIAIILCTVAAGAAVAAVRALPPPAAATAFARVADQPSPSPLVSTEQLADIDKFIDKHARKAVLDPDTSQDLKLSKDNAPVTADQVSLVDKDDPKGRHLLYRLSDGSGYLVVRQKSELRALYRLDKDLKKFSGVTVEPGRRKPLTTSEARRALHQELVIWAAVARREK
jgi:hypothetical protein